MLAPSCKKWLLWLVLVLPTSLLSSTPASGAGEWPVASQLIFQQGFTENTGVSVEQAAAMVRRAYGGRVLSASPVNRGGKRGVEVRVLIEGVRVKTVFVDSRGGIRARD